jgi:hypothetical protein
LPTAQNLRSAFPWGKKIKIKIKINSRSKADQQQIKSQRGGLRADLTLEAYAFPL